MRQFTNQDIVLIKRNLTAIIGNIYLNCFQAHLYIIKGIINDEQVRQAKIFIKANYPHIVLEPLPKPLLPLINVAKAMIVDAEIKPRYYNGYDRYRYDDYDSYTDDYYH
jgi:hypothetical protein